MILDELFSVITIERFILLCSMSVIIILLMIKKNRIKQRYEIPIYIGNDQTIGTKEIQNDSFTTVWNERGVCSVLADGIGENRAGKLASDCAVSIIAEQFLSQKAGENQKNYLSNAIRAAHNQITEKTRNSGGASVAVVHINKGSLNWASVGNVRIFLYRKNELVSLNKTQIYKHLLEKKALVAKISREEALRSKWKNEVINFLGCERLGEVETSETTIKLLEADQVVICSEGVYNNQTMLEIEHVLKKEIDLQTKAEEIIEAIQKKNLKRQENGTVIILANK